MSKILDGLNKEQKEAVAHGEGPLLIVAGAGTGKTTVITRRIAHLIESGVKPEEILAMAFGDKAAAEMEERVDQLLPLGYYDLRISTFHAFGERLLKEYGLAIGLPDFKVLDEVGQWLLVRNNLDKFELDYYRPLGNPTRFIKALVSHFSRCKDELITPEEYLRYAEKVRLNQDNAEAGSNLSVPSTGHLPSPGEKGDPTDEPKRIMEAANAYHVYQRLLTQNNALDFGDLINYSLELLKKRPEILQRLREQYKYILIDEFQDTNLAQYELIKFLAGPRNNLTVVGDDDQSIFKFRGASISNIMHFQQDYKAARFISLVQNYRSGQKILDEAYKFIRQNDPERLEVKLKIDKRLRGQDKDGKIRVIEAADYMAEARAVADQIKGNYNNYAILARSHDALEPFVAELDLRAITYIYFANRGLYRKPIVLDVISYFKLLDNYHENSAMYRVMKFPVWGISERALIELTYYAKKRAVSLFEALNNPSLTLPIQGEGRRNVLQSLEKHSRAARTKTVSELFAEIVKDLEFSKQVGTADQRGLQNAKYLETFNRKIQNFMSESHDKHLRTFMEELKFESEAGEEGKLEFDPEAGPEAVKLMTVHGAKGLEFDTVFIVGLVDKRFPSIERPEQIEIPTELVKEILPRDDGHLREERRLMYVAMTRTKQNLFLTRAFDYGGKTTKKPSRFLIELGLAKEEKSKATGKVNLTPTLSSRGEGVKLPVPQNFSYSQIATFVRCPLEYKYKYILKLPLPQHFKASFGLTIHNALQKFVNAHRQSAAADLFGSQKATLPDLKTLQKYYEESWIDDWYPDAGTKKKFRELGRAMLKIFYEESTAHPPQPKYVEHKFKVPLDKYWFRGVIDRADESKDGLVIIDYKTGDSIKMSADNKDQLLSYQWVASQFLGHKVADLQYWYLQDKLEKQSFLGEAADIEKLKAKLLGTIGEIILATKNDDFQARDLRTNHLRGCEYRELEI